MEMKNRGMSQSEVSSGAGASGDGNAEIVFIDHLEKPFDRNLDSFEISKNMNHR